MASNGISTLATKQARQKAKLDLAKLKRKGYNLDASGTATTTTPDSNAPFYRARNEYDITELPTRYSGDTIVDNPNTTGLTPGRPWI